MRKDTAGSTIWTIGTLVGAVQGGQQTSTKVEIPKFQRHLVWNNQQRLDLIDSIHRGYPIGSILLFKRPNPGGQQDLYQVVDGLQRTSTLLGYSQSPLLYVPSSAFPDSAVHQLVAVLKTDETHVRRSVVDWMRQTKQMTFLAGFTPDKLAGHLREEFGPVEDLSAIDPLVEILGPALDDLKAAVDIASVAIPVVTYSGPEGELPEIFERINQSGTKLNKYEVFAATWIASPTQVSNDEIRSAVNDKYNALISRGFQISGLEADKAIQDFNLFEYLFGMGKWLVKAHPVLFRENADPAETEPAAFSLSCVTRGHQLSRMGELPALMPRSDDSVIHPAAMEAALAASADFVQEVLAPYASLRLNSTTDGHDLAHGELQIVSMIARAAVGRYESRGDWSERAGWETDWAALRVAMPQHYLMDLIEETWRGPLYTLIFNRVWSVDEDGKIIAPSPHYATPIDFENWTQAADVWFEKQMSREQKSRSYVRAVDRVVLRFVYSDLVSHQQNKQVQFELEHLYPVSRLAKLISEDAPGWPISCTANLALFTKFLNREKLALTISEYLDANALAESERESLDRLLLCSVSDVEIGEGFDRATYEAFLRKRWETMKAHLLKGLKVEPG